MKQTTMNGSVRQDFALYQRVIAGRRCYVARTTRAGVSAWKVCIEHGKSRRCYWYQTAASAIAALRMWDGEGEPVGWAFEDGER